MGPWGSGPNLSPWEATSSCPGSCSPRAGPIGAFISRWGLSIPAVWRLQSWDSLASGPCIPCPLLGPRCGTCGVREGHPRSETILRGQLFPRQKVPSLPFSVFPPASSLWLFFCLL